VFLPSVPGELIIPHICDVVNTEYYTNDKHLERGDFVQFAERLKILMGEKSVTNYRLSKDLAVPESLVGYWLKNERQPAKDNLVKLADYFGVSIDYLVGRTENPEVNR
jgi:plasmid maintenance system antidote protein VapI